MKYMKSKFFTYLFVLIVSSLIILSFSACELFTFNELTELETNEEVSSKGSKDKNITTIVITPEFRDGKNPRSAYPQFTSEQLSSYKYFISGGFAFTEGSYNTTEKKIIFNVPGVVLDNKAVTVNVRAEISGSTYYLWSATKKMSCSIGETINETMYFSPYTYANRNGTIDLTVTTESGYTIDCTVTNKAGEDVSGITVESADEICQIKTGDDGVPYGTYIANFIVKNENDSQNIREFKSQEIVVWPGIMTDVWYLSDGTKNNVFNIPINKDEVTIYVKGSNPTGLYSSSGIPDVAEAKDTNSGSIKAPLKTIATALTKCKSPNTKYTILLDGDSAGFNLGDSTDYNNYNITIRGGGNSSNYSNITSGLAIYTNKAITLENIKISELTQTAIYYTANSESTSDDLSLKNCEITNNKMLGNVGGIKLNSANLHLQGKIVITGNAWRNNASDTTGSQKNVVLNSPNLIIIDGPLDSSSRIGVTYSVLSPASFCPGFATSCPGLDPKIIFSADFENYEITENDSGEPCITQRPPYATVQDIPYYSLSDTINAINAESGTISVVLYGAVTQNELGPSKTEGTILNAIRSKTAETDSLTLSVADGESITLAGSVFNFFESCKRLITADLRGFDTSDVTDMKRMFAYCENLSTLNISNFNTQKVTDMSYMFYYCKNLSEINVTSFNTSAVTNMNSMFNNCSSDTLVALNLSSFNTSNVTDMKEMFYYCRFVKKIYVSASFTTDKVTSSDNMFKGCSLLKGSKGTDPMVTGVYDITYARIDGVPTGTKGYFTSSAELP